MVWDEGQARGLIRDPIGAKEGGGQLHTMALAGS